MTFEHALQTFVSESRELLEDMEASLLAIDREGADADRVNAVFRAAHTIKGSAGIFGLDHVVAFTHVVESVLDRVRDGELVLGEELGSLMLRCRDHMGALVDAVADGRSEPEPELEARGAPLLQELRQRLQPSASGGAAPPAATPPAGSPPPAGASPVAGDDADVAETDHWHISVRFGQGVLRNGMDPLSFIRFLGTLGKVVRVAVVDDALPAAAAFDPEACYLGFEIALQSGVDKAAIESVFDFVRDDCRLTILPPHGRIADYVALIGEQQEPGRLGEILVACGTLTSRELAAALAAQQVRPGEKLGEILADRGAVRPQVVEAALGRQRQAREGGHESRSVRVDADKLDQLINLVGELIIAGANVNAIAQRARMNDLHESTSKLSLLVEQVRDSALQLRMVKIGATFGRFGRVVHDVSRELGKDIALEIAGEDTELDKTVVEKIGDPLMHLVRNAMDHGIEPAGVRAARGKPARGTLRLDAFHDSGSIVIRVQDDGGGLDRDRILAKAVERGLVEPGRTLTDAEAYQLVFAPGFSTAAQVTNLSGRGVGLDVVKRNITDLRGSVELASTPGAGTTVTIRLPLTLAIIDGFLVGIGKSVFALPLDMIEECVTFTAQEGHDFTDLRGEVLPLIRLRDLFGLRGAPPAAENVVVLKHGERRAGLVVDTLLGEFQTVIKPLGPMFGHVKCVSGATILGSGDVALILDVPALVSRSIHHEKQRAAGASPGAADPSSRDMVAAA